MDLYEAIDIVEDFIRYGDELNEWVPNSEEVQAIKVCLEAAKAHANV